MLHHSLRIGRIQCSSLSPQPPSRSFSASMPVCVAILDGEQCRTPTQSTHLLCPSCKTRVLKTVSQGFSEGKELRMVKNSGLEFHLSEASDSRRAEKGRDDAVANALSRLARATRDAPPTPEQEEGLATMLNAMAALLISTKE